MKKYSQQQLSAYLDGELSSEEMQQIRIWLAENSQAQQMLEDYQLQQNLVHDKYDAVLDEPIPEYLIHSNKSSNHFPWQQMAASFILFCFGFVLAWQLKPAEINFNSTQAKVQGALNAYSLYSKENLHAVEVKADVAHLMPWLSDRIGRDMNAPVYASLGYDFLGGRLMTEGRAAAALLMYQNSQGQRITLYVSNSPYAPSAAFYNQANVNSFIWQNKLSTFILVGEIEQKMLKNLAKMTNKQLQKF